MKGVHDCLGAADLLAADGIYAEVVDLRTLRPLDGDTVAARWRRPTAWLWWKRARAPAAGPPT